ncbi:MAG: SUMF1/EgtB/PvdO family nonheme iron enzyme [Deltaproteobacteria bacterium]|nr:SUMF1/EgtB/PvdO family nonheme iron enzyme [Deltaproteobacteria bacterium]
MTPVGWSVDDSELGGLSADLGGTIFEWCFDWYDAAYSTAGPRESGRGPRSGVERCARGPAWWVEKEEHRSPDRRWHFTPESRRPDLGFRGLGPKRGTGAHLRRPEF